MARDDMTYFKMMFDNIVKGQESLNGKMDSALSQLARQDEHLKNLNGKIAKQEEYNASTNIRFTDVYNEFQKRKDGDNACHSALQDKITCLEKDLMKEDFDKSKGFLKLEYKIALISIMVWIIATLGSEIAPKAISFIFTLI